MPGRKKPSALCVRAAISAATATPTNPFTACCHGSLRATRSARTSAANPTAAATPVRRPANDCTTTNTTAGRLLSRMPRRPPSASASRVGAGASAWACAARAGRGASTSGRPATSGGRRHGRQQLVPGVEDGGAVLVVGEPARHLDGTPSLDARDAAAAQEDDGDRPGAVVDVGLQARRARPGLQRHRLDRAGDAHLLAVAADLDRYRPLRLHLVLERLGLQLALVGGQPVHLPAQPTLVVAHVRLPRLLGGARPARP